MKACLPSNQCTVPENTKLLQNQGPNWHLLPLVFCLRRPWLQFTTTWRSCCHIKGMKCLLSSQAHLIHSMALHQEERKLTVAVEVSEDDEFHLHQVPDKPIAGNGHGHRVTFRSPVVRPGSISSTPHLVPQLVSFNVSRIPDIEKSGKDTDSEAQVRPRTPHYKTTWMRSDASITSHNLQLEAEEFRKICEPKIQKCRGRY